MKHVHHLISLIGCVALFAACESTNTTGKGNQETKRLAALQRQAQRHSEMDEAHANLWSAQRVMLNTDGSVNPAR
jgi:hypothetical protein